MSEYDGIPTDGRGCSVSGTSRAGKRRGRSLKRKPRDVARVVITTYTDGVDTIEVSMLIHQPTPTPTTTFQHWAASD